jgi:hypothetical protein
MTYGWPFNRRVAPGTETWPRHAISDGPVIVLLKLLLTAAIGCALEAHSPLILQGSGHGAPIQTPRTHDIERTVVLAGTGLWGRPTIDSPARRVYIPRKDGLLAPSSGEVVVLDLDTLQRVGAVGAGGESVLIDDHLGLGVVSGPSVRVFETSTLRIGDKVEGADLSTSIALDRLAHIAFVASAPTKSVQVIDLKRRRVVSTVGVTEFPVPGSPSRVIASGNGGVFEVAVSEGPVAWVLAFDASPTLIRRSNVSPWCVGASSLASDAKAGLLFVGCQTSGSPPDGPGVLVLHSEDGQFANRISLPDRPRDIAFDPSSGSVVVLCDRAMFVAKTGPSSAYSFETVEIPPHPQFLAVDEDRGRLVVLYAGTLPNAEDHPGAASDAATLLVLSVRR